MGVSIRYVGCVKNSSEVSGEEWDNWFLILRNDRFTKHWLIEIRDAASLQTHVLYLMLLLLVIARHSEPSLPEPAQSPLVLFGVD